MFSGHIGEQRATVKASGSLDLLPRPGPQATDAPRKRATLTEARQIPIDKVLPRTLPPSPQISVVQENPGCDGSVSRFSQRALGGPRLPPR